MTLGLESTNLNSVANFDMDLVLDRQPVGFKLLGLPPLNLQ